MPGPLVAEPQPRQQVERGGIRPTVVDRAADQDIFRGGLGVLDEHVEVAVLVEHAGVEQLVLGLIPAPLVIRANQVVVRIGGLRILVQVAHVRVRGRGVEVEVVLLDVLPMVAFGVGQPEQALLHDRVLAVPHGQRETQPLPFVADAGQPVLAPAVGPRPRLVVGEVVPGVASLAVVLAHGPPLTFAQVRAPQLPGRPVRAGFFETGLLGVHRRSFVR